MNEQEFFMSLALHEAEIAASLDEVPIGCVIVKNGKVITSAHNERENTKNPTGHAEILAILEASRILNDWMLIDCDLYVTIEPCLMCAGAIIQARIGRVFYGSPDPKGGAFGSSLNVLEGHSLNHYPRVTGGILQEECSAVIKNYFKNKREEKKERKNLE